jgi:2-phospho-L-lactate transferase/gluconeogenesis factor (CofD/UPF0052 family)
MHVVLFSGGRGAGKIAQSLAARSQVKLTVVVNAYDDGLSTGTVRRLVPGMLGPSDVRKTVSNLLEVQDEHGRRMANLLEHRLSLDGHVTRVSTEELLRRLLSSVLDSRLKHVSRLSGDLIEHWIGLALEVMQQAASDDVATWIDGMSVGNLVLGGAFLDGGRNFNLAINNFVEAVELRNARILNVTEGENRVLVGLKRDGTFLHDEVSIVDRQSDVPIEQIFLLPRYLTPHEEESITRSTFSEAMKILTEFQHLPSLNEHVEIELNSSDVIVYGPGTQHSSLYPSYMTKGLADVIASKSEIEKVFICNLSPDHDIQSETVRSLVLKATKYFNAGAKDLRDPSAYVTQCLISTTPGSNQPWGFEELDTGVGTIGVHLGKWTSDGLTHDGNKVANAVSTLARKPGHDEAQSLQTVSIVVPVLDEAERLPTVLEKLLAHDWLLDGVIPEFIVVDGGSTDGTAQIAASFPGVQLVQMYRGTGRGEALCAGISASKGEYIVTFPGDDEYQLDAIESVVRTLRAHQTQVVFGSRVGLCVDSDKRLQTIYGGRTRTYFLSKWGGVSLSLLSGLFWRRWVADVLTSVKGFRREFICQLTLKGYSADWDARVIVDSSRMQIAIAEVPVQYSPRTPSEGKKIRARDGVRALRVLLVERLR